MPQRRMWRLRSLGGRLVILRKADLTSTEVPLSPGAGWQLIERLLHSPAHGNDLDTLAAAISSGNAGHFPKLNRTALQRAILDGSLVLLAISAGPPNNPGATQNAEPLADQILSARVVKAWVEMELVDTTGVPVPGQHYSCMLPDGEIREGTLDSRGRVRFDGIDPGNCVFTFPGLDRTDWQPQG